MATVPCPACGLPRAEDLADAAPCPVCGHVGRVAPPDEPDHDRPWVIDEQPASAPLDLPIGRTAGGGRVFAGVVFGFVAGTAAGAAGVFGWQAYRDRPPTPESPSFAQTEPTPDDANRPNPLPPAAPADPPAPPTGPVTPAVATQPAPVVPPPVPVPQPAPVNPFRPGAPRAVRIDNAQTYAPLVEPGANVVARGTVKRLVVSGLGAGAVLDCSELEAAEVVVLGALDGGSRLSVRAPGGRVTFHARVVGKSKVNVAAPGGTVTFAAAGDGGAEGATIDGGAVVEVTAGTAAFKAPIGGAGTRVAVTLTAGGGLQFTEVGGRARLEYGKANPADPDPTVVAGTVRPPAVVVKVP